MPAYAPSHRGAFAEASARTLDVSLGWSRPLPAADVPTVLVCSKGPKSLVALDYLAEHCPKAVCVEGGVVAWDKAKLPTEDV